MAGIGSSPRAAIIRTWRGGKGHLMSRDVMALAYVNLFTKYQGPYEHDFAHTGVELWAMSDGGLYLHHPRVRLWSDYIVNEDT